MPATLDTPQQKAARTRRRFRAIVIILTLLCIDLVTTSINTLVTSLDKFINPYLLTALGMMIVVVLFYPAFEFLSRWSNTLVEKSIDVSANMVGRKNALIVVVIVLLFVLYVGFLFLWFNKSLFSDLVRAVQKSHFIR
ncbi:MAG: hypothetical protein CMR00_03830 [[Chlorobium] sp. 445]|nr:MAG: hypothetical protein CMR00_03830 [[Chlorobium] sp. 445]